MMNCIHKKICHLRHPLLFVMSADDSIYLLFYFPLFIDSFNDIYRIAYGY